MPSIAKPRILTIAGSDSGGGAGIQADLKTFLALDCYGMSVITALTAQNTKEVRSTYSVPASFVGEQFETIVQDIGVDAIKIGMLHNAEIVRAVAHCLKNFSSTPCVLDPVMIAKSGDALLVTEGLDALQEFLFPCISVLTPNIPEAEVLTNRKISCKSDMKVAALDLLDKVPAVVLKGGHLEGDFCSDLIVTRSGEELWLDFPRIVTRNNHGTGCTYSAAIASFLGKGRSLSNAVIEARKFLQAAIASAVHLQIGLGHGPVDHAVLIRSTNNAF